MGAAAGPYSSTLSMCPRIPATVGWSASIARRDQGTRNYWSWPAAWRRHRRARLDLGVGRGKRFGHGRAGHRCAGAGGRTVGVIPKALVHRELADVEADELVVTESMPERKQVMEDRADAFIALPGGIGTLEEFFEAWTAGYLGMHDKPVVMLDPFGHYDGLRAWLHGLIDSGYVTRRTRPACGGGRIEDARCLRTGQVMAITRMDRVSDK